MNRRIHLALPLVDKLIAGLGIGKRTGIRKLLGGREHEHYHVTTKKYEFVIRVYRRGTSSVRVEDELALLSYLKAHKFPTPGVIGEPYVVIDGRIAVALEYVAGIPLEPGLVTSARVVGKLLAAFHMTTPSFSLRRAPLRRYPRTKEAALRMVSDARLRSRTVERRIIELIFHKFSTRCERRIIHNDAHAGNILLSKSRATLLDFGDIEEDILAQDLGRAVAHIHKQHSVAQVDATRALFDGYESVHPIPAEQRSLIPKIIQYNISLYLLRSASGPHRRPQQSVDAYSDLLSCRAEHLFGSAIFNQRGSIQA